MSIDALTDRASDAALDVIGVCHTEPEDGLGKGTLALLGPKEPGFWVHVQRSPEFLDGASEPLDRWSHLVVTRIARDVGGSPLFPFGEPARPFISWALRSGRAWVSPVGLLVHDVAGLLVSYRGAVLFDEVLPLGPTPERPCDACVEKPCLTACPVGALGKEGYDLATCHSYLDIPGGRPCMSGGCLVRRACPVSQSYPRTPAQSAFHMRAFHNPR
ncbi:MAG: ferredoxin [Pseudomonadota bacterium]